MGQFKPDHPERLLRRKKNTGSIIVPAPFAMALLVAYERKAHGDRNMSFFTFYTCFDLGLIVSHYYTTIG